VIDQGKLRAAIDRLASFITDFPPSPTEYHVFQFHEIIKILEQASGQDLSHFKISPDRVNSKVNNNPAIHWHTPYASKAFVEHSYFCSRVRGLMSHVKTALEE
jgi:hypothetical protein